MNYEDEQELNYLKKRINTVLQDTNNYRNLNSNLLNSIQSSLNIFNKSVSIQNNGMSASEINTGMRNINDLNKRTKNLDISGGYQLNKDLVKLVNNNLGNLKEVEDLRKNVINSKNEQNESYCRLGDESIKYKNKVENYNFADESFANQTLNKTNSTVYMDQNSIYGMSTQSFQKKSSKVQLKPLKDKI